MRGDWPPLRNSSRVTWCRDEQCLAETCKPAGRVVVVYLEDPDALARAGDALPGECIVLVGRWCSPSKGEPEA